MEKYLAEEPGIGEFLQIVVNTSEENLESVQEEEQSA